MKCATATGRLSGFAEKRFSRDSARSKPGGWSFVIATDLAERGRLPGWLIRIGRRRLLRKRLAAGHSAEPERQAEMFASRIEDLARSEIAIEAGAANEQHYEVPVAFYQRVLGRHLKYSSGMWNRACPSLTRVRYIRQLLANISTWLKPGGVAVRPHFLSSYAYVSVRDAR